MPRHKPKKRVLASTPPQAMAELRRALSRRKKAELVEFLVELAQDDRGVQRQLTARYAVAATSDQLVAATRQAIADATAFDPRDINHNFDYDDEAYREVQRNLARLITAGQLRPAMELALELMKHGSYQVEMSDEGMMTEDIEDGLKVVLKALDRCDLPAGDIIAWCTALRANDRVGFIASEPLESLRKRFQAAASR
jgi:predicted outer membrane protein